MYREQPCRKCGSHDFDSSNHCQSCKNERTRLWRAANHERSKEQTNRNNNRRRSTEEGRLYHVAANAASSRKRKTRVPAWADLEAIKEFYLACPPGMEVDHIIPLCGKLVSGLHVLENLQYLTRKDNRDKSNIFEV